MRYFKRNSKPSLVFGALFCAFVMAGATYCSAGPASAATAYAETPRSHTITKDTVTLLESLQNANRQVSAAILPSVVTLSVTETKKFRNPLSRDGFPWFFFGLPNQEGSEESDEKTVPDQEYKAEGMGSGVIVRKAGNTYYILTNQHVTGSAEKIIVKLHDGRTMDGKLIGGDPRKDVALVSFETTEKDIVIAELGNSDSVEVGDIVFAVGSPLGYMSTVTQGMVSAVGRSGGPNNNINDFIQTDAAINQGNSGGPLVNIYGQVIGINTWIASSSGGSQGLGFSIPINNVKNAIDSLISDGKLKYGWVGVQLVGTDEAILKALGIEQNNGALAVDVFLGSPAFKGGIRPGDFVIRLNGKEVKNVDQLVRDVGDLRSGTTAEFTVIRDGSEKTVSVKIEERDQKIVADSAKLWPGFIPYIIDDEIIKKLKLDKKQTGVVVTNIKNKTPAAIIGLKSGDIITAVNDVPVNDIRSFYRELAKAKKEIWFDIIREEQTLSTMRYKFS
ncbi:MAG: Do family serine endopeptidase [Treponema sp.]